MIVPLLFSVLAVGHATSYRGHSVLRCSPANATQLSLLHDMAETGTYDFWREPTRRGGAVDVMVSPVQAKIFEEKMETERIPCKCG